MRPLYRSSSWKKEERALARKKKSKSWFGKQFDSVLFVQSSPDELLKKEVQRIVKEHGFKVRVVEKGGRPLQSFLQRSDVDPQLDCLDSECSLCHTSPEGLCRMESVGYRICLVKSKELML